MKSTLSGDAGLAAELRIDARRRFLRRRLERADLAPHRQSRQAFKIHVARRLDGERADRRQAIEHMSFAAGVAEADVQCVMIRPKVKPHGKSRMNKLPLLDRNRAAGHSMMVVSPRDD